MYEIIVTRKEKLNTYTSVENYNILEHRPAILAMNFRGNRKRILIPIIDDIIDIEIEVKEDK
jgi:hypothetical protein